MWLILVAISTSAIARPQPWRAAEPTFAFAAIKDIPVRMDDGTVLRADEYFPTDPVTGARAPGRFPVLLMQTPYGKATGLQSLGDYFVRRGYVLVIADLRGFGGSQGQAEWFGARVGRDGAELADWASKLDEADGNVGLMGCSYLGVIQFFTANSLSHDSPVKALGSRGRPSGKYQAIVGDWIHSEHTGDTLLPVLLEWFDIWLKGQKTGMADTRMPMHLFVRGANRWIDSATFPITDEARSFNLSPGKLATSACADCSQELIWAPEGEGTTLSFDSGPLEEPLIIGGPGAVTVFVRSTRPEIELSATLYEVAPDGSRIKITNGAQLGSHRALNTAGSWHSKDGRLIRPNHFFTKAKSSVVPIGATVRIDIELLPALYQVPAGHQLRLVVATQPTPWCSCQMCSRRHRSSCLTWLEASTLSPWDSP